MILTRCFLFSKVYDWHPVAVVLCYPRKYPLCDVYGKNEKAVLFISIGMEKAKGYTTLRLLFLILCVRMGGVWHGGVVRLF